MGIIWGSPRAHPLMGWMTGAGAGMGVPYSDCLGRIARAKIGTGQGCPSACSASAVLAGQLSWAHAGCSTLGPYGGMAGAGVGYRPGSCWSDSGRPARVHRLSSYLQYQVGGGNINNGACQHIQPQRQFQQFPH